MPVTRMLTARTLRSARVALNWSLGTAAEKTGLNAQTISRIETGRTKHVPESISRLEEVYTEAGIDFIDEHTCSSRRVADPLPEPKKRQKKEIHCG